MNYIKITKNDIANGNGVRVVLWVAGCDCHCPGCHNPETWDFEAGQKFDDTAKQELFAALAKPHIQGLTLSGGHPLAANNTYACEQLLKEVKQKFPNKDVWVYTGYTYEGIKKINSSILQYIDVLVDGPYIAEQRDITLAFRGSRNQRIIKLNKGEMENE